jgi:hypothetical protein
LSDHAANIFSTSSRKSSPPLLCSKLAQTLRIARYSTADPNIVRRDRNFVRFESQINSALRQGVGAKHIAVRWLAAVQ